MSLGTRAQDQLGSESGASAILDGKSDVCDGFNDGALASGSIANNDQSGEDRLPSAEADVAQLVDGSEQLAVFGL